VVLAVKLTEVKTGALQAVRTLGEISVDHDLIAMLLPEVKILERVDKAGIQDRQVAIVLKGLVPEQVQGTTEELERATIEAQRVVVEETAVVETAAAITVEEDLADVTVEIAIDVPTNRTRRKIDVQHVWNHQSP
jgi:hypothetical protein